MTEHEQTDLVADLVTGCGCRENFWIARVKDLKRQQQDERERDASESDSSVEIGDEYPDTAAILRRAEAADADATATLALRGGAQDGAAASLRNATDIELTLIAGSELTGPKGWFFERLRSACVSKVRRPCAAIGELGRKTTGVL